MERDDRLKVSVIIPVYNAMPFFESCLKSVLAQTYEKTEIIIVDDGSDDGSQILCDEYRKTDARIHVIHKKREGLVTARKTGMEQATGDYFVFADADDEIDRDEIELLCMRARETKPDVVLFGLKEESETGNVVRSNVCGEGEYDRDAIHRKILPCMICSGDFFHFGVLPNLVCKFVKRDFYNRILVNVSPDVTFGEDADFSYQIISQASSVCVSDIHPYHYKKRVGTMVWKGVSKEALRHLENDLKGCFLKAGVYDCMKNQLDTYMTYVKLLKAPSEVIDFAQFDGRNLALYGAGGFGQAVYGRNSNRITMWVDRDYKKYSAKGLNVESEQELIRQRDRYDVIFIAVLQVKVCEEIESHLCGLGIEKPVYFYRPTISEEVCSDKEKYIIESGTGHNDRQRQICAGCP